MQCSDWMRPYDDKSPHFRRTSCRDQYEMEYCWRGSEHRYLVCPRVEGGSIVHPRSDCGTGRMCKRVIKICATGPLLLRTRGCRSHSAPLAPGHSITYPVCSSSFPCNITICCPGVSGARLSNDALLCVINSCCMTDVASPNHHIQDAISSIETRGVKSETSLPHQTRKIPFALLLLPDIRGNLTLQRLCLDLAQSRLIVVFMKRASIGPYAP